MTEIERLTLDRDEARRWVVQYGQAFERLRAAVAEFESTHEAIQFFVDRSPSELAAEAKEDTPPAQAPDTARTSTHVVQPLDLVLWAREALERMRVEVAETRAALAAVREVVAGLDADARDNDAAALARDVLAVLPPEDTTPDLDFGRTVPPVAKVTDPQTPAEEKEN